MRFFLLFLLLSSPALAGGLNASFEHSRLDCPDDPSLIFCSKGIVDGSNNLIDETENLLTDRVELDDWSETGTCAVTADQYRNPYDGTVDADYLDNTGDNNGDRRIDTVGAGAAAGDIFTGSIWIKADYNHTCTIGLVEGGVATAWKDVSVTTQWRRYFVPRTIVGGGTGEVGLRSLPGERGIAVGQAYFYGGQVVQNDRYIPGMGIFINPTDQAITKPRHDLAPHLGDPTPAFAHLQGQGNKMPARAFDGTNQKYRKAHDASMNIFDSDHSIAMYFLGDSSLAAWDRLFAHGVLNTDGFEIMVNAAFTVVAYYNSNASSAAVACPAVAVNDDLYHDVRVVRDGNTATCTLDGVAGTPTDITGEGIDTFRVFVLASGDGGANTYVGQISRTVFRSRTLSTDELAEEREEILGIATNWSSSNAWDFERSTVAYKTFSNKYENTAPMHSMDLVAVNHPRVAGQGSGLLIEGEVTQVHGYTEVFNSWSQTGTCAVAADNYAAPNGTSTADTLDNTGGILTDKRTVTTADLGDLTGRVFTASVWIRADTPHVCSFYVWENTVGHVTGIQDVFVTNEWQRFSASGTCAGGGTGLMAFSVLPGDYSAATGVAEFWGANLTETSFVTSYIPNAGVQTSQVTRTADDMTIDPHPAGTNEYILPLSLTPTIASDLTVYFESRCEWSGVADLGGVNRMLLSISGNTGAGARQADADHNRLAIYVNATGDLTAGIEDSSSTQHTLSTAVDPVNYDDWFSVRLFIDFSDLTRMNLWMQQCPGECSASNEAVTVAGSVGRTGTGSFFTDDTLIRAGQWYSAIINSFCHVRNLRIYNAEVGP